MIILVDAILYHELFSIKNSDNHPFFNDFIIFYHFPPSFVRL
jgi:hypothetical protein